MSNQFDLIVIGSGIGGLTVASIYTRLFQKKVLILEQHTKLGGYTHIFKRENGKFIWDVGLHYVGGMKQGEMTREIMDFITNSKVKWNSMPDVFEKFVYPDFTFSVHSQSTKYQEDLVQMFPEEKLSIKKYFKDVKIASDWFGRYISTKSLPETVGKIGSFFNQLGTQDILVSTKEYLDKNFKDKKLKALLVSQWGDYGLPPSMSSFVIHSLIVQHYLNGAYYPEGTSFSIAESVKSILTENGGRFILGAKATEILLKDNVAIGVKTIETQNGVTSSNEYYAPIVVSNVGAYNTYTHLLPSFVSGSFQKELEKLTHPTISNITLFIGFRDDPRKLGVNGENYWIYSDYDHDATFTNQNDIINGKVNSCFLSFPSLKDPKSTSHTAELIVPVDYESFAKWKDQPLKNRDQEYVQIKNKITEALLDFIENRISGFKDLIEYKELSTPLTNESYTLHYKGGIYGLPCTMDRFQADWLNAKTPIQNLYLTGADVGSPGIVGAMMGGFVTLTQFLGFGGFLNLMKEIKKK